MIVSPKIYNTKLIMSYGTMLPIYLMLNDEEYSIGTVIPVSAQHKQFYLFAVATLSDEHRSKVSEEDLKIALDRLWDYFANKAGKDKFIIPIIGTGRGRIKLTRIEVIKLIVLSFLSSCRNHICADSLTISISPDDVKTHQINLNEIIDWIKVKVKYTELE